MDSGPAIAPTSIETKTIHKIRIRIIPLLFLLYIVAYLDRINIGFAALTMNKELAITSQQFGLLVGIFFFGYFLFEIPSNLLLHKIGARDLDRTHFGYLGNCGHADRIRAPCSPVVRRTVSARDRGGRLLSRNRLYLTYWFRQREQAQAIALFATGLPITSILGAPVSGLILDRVHWLGIGSWRWLLILEGLPAVACGVLSYFLLPSRPAEANFLTRDEKDWVTAALALEEEQKKGKHQISAMQALADGRVWHLASICFTMAVGLYSISFWMPQLVESLSTRYSNTVVGFLVTIPHLVGLLVMVLVPRSSDQKLERRYHIAIPAIVGGIALLLLGTTSSPFFSILLLSFVALGIYSFYGPFFSLPSEFLTGFSAASGIALINSVGSLGGFVGPYAIGAINGRTGSLYGGLAAVGVSLFLSATLILLLPKERRPVA